MRNAIDYLRCMGICGECVLLALLCRIGCGTSVSVWAERRFWRRLERVDEINDRLLERHK